LPFLLFTGTSNSTHLNYVTGWSVKASDAMIENRIHKGFLTPGEWLCRKMELNEEVMLLSLSSRFIGNVYIIQCKGRLVLDEEVKALEAALDQGAREFTRFV
jgi:hypothetical protein